MNKLPRLHRYSPALMLAALLVAVASPAAAQAQPTAPGSAKLLVADVVIDGPSPPAALSGEVPADLRTALAGRLRQGFGTVFTPPLSPDERRCGNLNCAVEVIQHYLADVLVLPSAQSVPEIKNSEMCTASVSIIASPTDQPNPSPRQLDRRSDAVPCTATALQDALYTLTADLLTRSLGIVEHKIPACPPRYHNATRGLLTGIGLGLAVAGGGLGFGIMSEGTREGVVYDQSGQQVPDLTLRFSADKAPLSTSRSLGLVGFGVGLAMTGAALVPWENLAAKPIGECRPIAPAHPKFTMWRSLLVGFFGTSALASLASTIYFGTNPAINVVVPVDMNNTPLFTVTGTSLPSSYLAGSATMLGLYTAGLVITLAVP